MRWFLIAVTLGVVIYVVATLLRARRPRTDLGRHLPPVAGPAEAPPRQASPPRRTRPNPAGRFSGLSAMVIEDSATIQRLVEMVLAPEGLELRSARDYRSARLGLVGQRADLLIVDHDLWRAEASPDSGGAPVVLLRGKGNDRADDGGPGVVAVISKPFDSEDLIEAVERALATSPIQVLCPVCGHPAGEEPIACQTCGAAHHAECWTLNDGCGRCGQAD